MKLYMSYFVTAFWIMLGNIASVGAEPITIQGVNWSMPIADQIQVLEQKGLNCVQEPGWNAIISPREGSSELDRSTICIQSSNNRETVFRLRTLFAEWLQICDRLEGGYLSNDCLKFDRFTNLRDDVKKVYYKDDGTLIFDCSYIGSCGFDPNSIVSQLQNRIIPKTFSSPIANSYVSCADGDDGDSICVHARSKDVWLLKSSLLDKMQF